MICLKCLEKDPRQRYSSADALAVDLNAWLSGEPILARPVGNAARLWMWCRRNPAVAGATAVAASALIVVAVLSLLFAGQQKRHATEQTKAKNEISGLANNLATKNDELVASLAVSNLQLAKVNFERAERAFDKGENGLGMLLLVETWKYAAKANDPDWQYLARANLSYWRYYCPELRGLISYGEGATHVAFSPDGRTMLIERRKQSAYLQDVETGRSIGLGMIPTGGIETSIFSPDGKRLIIVGRQNEARLWDTSSGRQIGEPLKHQGRVTSAAFSPNGRVVVTVGKDARTRFWNTSTGQSMSQPIEHKGSVDSVTYSPDGKTILTLSYTREGVRLWNSSTHERVGGPWDLVAFPNEAAFSPDGKILAVSNSDKSTRLWEVTSGKAIGRPINYGGADGVLEYAPDGKAILTSSYRDTRCSAVGY